MNEISSLSEFNRFVSKLEPMEVGMFGGRRFKEKGNSTVNYSLKEIVDKMKILMANQNQNPIESVEKTFFSLEILKKLDVDATIKVNDLHGINGKIKQFITSIKQLFFGFNPVEFHNIELSILQKEYTLKDIMSLLNKQYFTDQTKILYLQAGATLLVESELKHKAEKGRAEMDRLVTVGHDLLKDACDLLSPDEKNNLKLILKILITQDRFNSNFRDSKLSNNLAEAKNYVNSAFLNSKLSENLEQAKKLLLLKIAGECPDNWRDRNAAFNLLLSNPEEFLGRI